jgi:hypothetical protein
MELAFEFCLMKIEIKEHKDEDFSEPYNAIFVDDALFDWGMDQQELEKAKKFAGQDVFLRRSVHGDIQRYFLDCFSKFVGQEVTIQELNESLEKGHIDVPSRRD